jgi:capsular polysaccharide biosynthesis protein
MRQYVHFPLFISPSSHSFRYVDAGHVYYIWYKPVHLKGSYRRVIAIGDQWMSSGYAHFFLSVLAPLFGFPAPLINNSHFIAIHTLPSYFMEGLSWLGLHNRTIVLENGDYIYAEEVLTCNMWFIFDQVPICIHRFRAFVKHLYNLDATNAFRYVFINRGGTSGKSIFKKKEDSRKIRNMPAIFRTVQEKFPQIPWERTVFGRTIPQNAILFNTLKFLFTPHGAGLTNCMFMQVKIVVCEVQGEFEYYGYMSLCRLLGMYYIVSRLPWMRHWGKSAGMPDSLAVAMVVEGLKCLEL